MNFDLNCRLSLAHLLSAILLMAFALPQTAAANDWDIATVGSAHASIDFDYNIQRADPGSLRYLARFLRAAEHLPDGVKVVVICYEDTVSLDLGDNMLTATTPEARSELEARAARANIQEPIRHFSRLRTCLAQAARKVRRAFPDFRPAQESTEWYALTLDDPTAAQRASEDGTINEAGNEFANGLAHSNGAIAGSHDPFGFFLTRTDAQNASGNLTTPQRMNRRANAALLCHAVY